MKKSEKASIGILMKLVGYLGLFGVATIKLVSTWGFPMGFLIGTTFLCLTTFGEYIHWKNYWNQ